MCENLSPTEQQVDLEHDDSLPEILSQDTEIVDIESLVALAYGDMDLGRRAIISGGEVLEI